MKSKVIIIGGGVGGLATAALLAKEGYRVTVIEKNRQLGGRMRTIEAKGFTFDMGPSWYLMPEVFDRFFAFFGKKTSEYYRLKRLNPQYKIFWSKGDHVSIANDMKKNLAYFESLEPGVGKKINAYLKKSHQLYEMAMQSFLYKDFFAKQDIVTLLRSVSSIFPYLFRSVDKQICSYTTHYRIRQILSYWSVFLGASPYSLPAIYSMMSDVDLRQGVYYPMGGMKSVVAAFVSLCRDNGVRLTTGTEVKKIIIKNGKAVGVQTTKGEIVADIIISNADYPFTETRLLPKKYSSYPEEYWKKRSIAPSMFLLYLGVKGKLPQLKHHNFYFSSQWKKHFDQIDSLNPKPVWPDDPSYYMCKPSATDPSVMPSGTENIFVLVPISPLLKDTDKMRLSYRDKIIKHMEQVLSLPVEKNIIFEKMYSIEDFKKDYNAYSGTALGISHTLLQSAFLRPRLQSKKIDNLYYVGQYTLPGTGVPMCIISAELVSGKIIKRYKDERSS